MQNISQWLSTVQPASRSNYAIYPSAILIKEHRKRNLKLSIFDSNWVRNSIVDDSMQSKFIDIQHNIVEFCIFWDIACIQIVHKLNWANDSRWLIDGFNRFTSPLSLNRFDSTSTIINDVTNQINVTNLVRVNPDGTGQARPINLHRNWRCLIFCD